MYNRQLETFLKVAEAGSFSKAAEQLYISPTAVIKQIKLLEEDLGFELFIRTHRGVRLTNAGESMVHDAKYLIQYANDSLSRARQAMLKDEKTIRIGASLITPSEFLLDFWPRIQPHCPNLKLQIVPYENTPENAREILKNLGMNIDLVAGLFDPAMLEFRGCAALETSKQPLYVAVPINHHLSSRKKLNITDLFGEEVLLVERGNFQYFDIVRDDMWQRYPQIKIADFKSFNIQVFNQCVNDNRLMIAIKPWENVHPLLKLVPVDWSYYVPFGLLHSPQPSEQVTEFLDAVKIALNLDAK